MTITGLTPTDYDPDAYARSCAEFLETHPYYQVLKRFVPRADYVTPTDRMRLFDGAFVDVETTGLNTETDQIIELGLLPFQFDDMGNVYMVHPGFSWFNDPGRPIPPEITELTGITDEMVKGKSINLDWIESSLPRYSLVVAHNADYDRRLCERLSPVFRSLPWGCSYKDVDWKRFGCACSKLEHVLTSTCHEFFDAHRALDDCRVGLHVLAAARLDGLPALSYLLDSAREPTIRLWATGAPFGAKDALKARKYRWHDGARGHAKSWYVDLPASDAEAEKVWLLEHAQVIPGVTKITARDRYSIRSDV